MLVCKLLLLFFVLSCNIVSSFIFVSDFWTALVFPVIRKQYSCEVLLYLFKCADVTNLFVSTPVSSRIAALFWLEHLQPCLQVVCYEQVSQTIPRGGPRSQIAIPAQGMIEFRDALTELLDEFGTDDQGRSPSHHVSFDC